jgi:hypothetical protein
VATTVLSSPEIFENGIDDYLLPPLHRRTLQHVFVAVELIGVHRQYILPVAATFAVPTLHVVPELIGGVLWEEDRLSQIFLHVRGDAAYHLLEGRIHTRLKHPQQCSEFRAFRGTAFDGADYGENGFFGAGVSAANERLGDWHRVVVNVDFLLGVVAEAVIRGTQQPPGSLPRTVPQSPVLFKEAIRVGQRHVSVFRNLRPSLLYESLLGRVQSLAIPNLVEAISNLLDSLPDLVFSVFDGGRKALPDLVAVGIDIGQVAVVTEAVVGAGFKVLQRIVE